MSVLYIVVPIALTIASLAVVACVQAIRRGQFDDLDTPAVRVALDDSAPAPQPIEPSLTSKRN